eukprot:GFYU01035035.1.p2 GENE.GFYU01035035.1~~GFYU01035035.1.p2  ORF type:complete len:103 (-),score=11.03 GFYU01035035.1:10-318(-)
MSGSGNKGNSKEDAGAGRESTAGDSSRVFEQLYTVPVPACHPPRGTTLNTAGQEALSSLKTVFKELFAGPPSGIEAGGSTVCILPWNLSGCDPDKADFVVAV